MEDCNQTEEFDELPRCHYCSRYAFELRFQELAVCDKCIERLSGGRVWRVVRRIEDGAVFLVTASSAEEPQQVEIIGEGTFTEMWTLSHRDDPNYG